MTRLLYHTDKKIYSWNEVENKITHEMSWLKQRIETFYQNEEANSVIHCKECVLRKIALLIISGEVLAKEIIKKPLLKSFWKLNKRIEIKQNKTPLYHGKDWHRETIKTIETYFLSTGYKVVREPNLRWGRADLGIYKKSHRDLYIEIGTTSLSKLWINLVAMPNITYLLHPSDNLILEFNTKENDKKLDLFK